jgi:Sec-independent protein secretion pathway component TatC
VDKLRGSLYSRSVWFGVIVAVLGLIEQASPTLISQLIPADYAGAVTALFGLAVWALRWVTTKPLEDKV